MLYQQEIGLTHIKPFDYASIVLHCKDGINRRTTYIKNMLWTTLPAFVLALLVFSLIGSDGAATPENIAEIRSALASRFSLSPWVLSPLALMLLLIYLKVPAYPAILICTFSGTLYAACFQPEVVRTMAIAAHPNTPAPLIQGLWMALFSG